MVRISDEARERLPDVEVRWARLERAGEADDDQASVPEGERSIEEIKADPVAQAYRSFFWAVDVDPTKRRPAGEALARRQARDGLPEIHPLVDAYNHASAATLIALSAFDVDALAGELVLDAPRLDDALDALGEAEPVEPVGEQPVWRDEEGPVGLAAYRDGQRTALGPDTQAALVVAVAPAGVDERLDEAFAIVEEQAQTVGWRLVEGPQAIR